jgi:hypothetical protein
VYFSFVTLFCLLTVVGGLVSLVSSLAISPVPTPTLPVSSKIKDSLGVNLEANVDWQVSNYFVDAMKSARGWGRVDAPWIVDTPVDDNGWPLGDSGIVIATCEGNFRCGGTYLLSFEGTANVSIFFYGSIEQMTVINGWSYAEVPIPPLAPAIMLVFTNTVTGVRNVRLLRPGYERNTTKLFTDEFLTALSPFSAIRVMDLVNTNEVNFVSESPYFSSAPILWTNRSLPTDATQSGPYGVCWEYIIQLANEAGVDLWINVPYHADDLYITSLLQLLHTTLDSTRLVYLEYSNEVWNWQFAQAHLNLWKAQHDDEASGQHLWMYAKEVVRLSNLTRAVVGEGTQQSHRYRVVLGTQIGWSPPEWPLLEMLNFVSVTYGPPERFFFAFASAPYYAEPLPVNATSIPVVHEFMTSVIDSYAEIFSRLLLIAEENGLRHVAYEGGPHHQGQVETNLEIRMNANRHPAMVAITKRYLRDTWYRSGGGLFCYFTLAGRYSRYGSWGATEDIRNLTTAKYSALKEISTEELPSVVYITVSPSMAPTLSNLLTFYNHPIPVGSFEFNYQTATTPVDQETVTSLWTSYMTGFDLQPGVEDYFFINGTLRFSSQESAPEGVFCIEVINADLLFFTRNSEGTLLSGSSYTVSFFGKGSDQRQSHVTIRIEEETNRTRLIAQSFLLTTEWQFFDFSFIASGTGWFDFFVTSSQGNFFDNFRVLPSSSSPAAPSRRPSASPTPLPSQFRATGRPTAMSRCPSIIPTVPPSERRTSFPTRQPTCRPTAQVPWLEPQITSTVLPSESPTVIPISKLATSRPTAQRQGTQDPTSPSMEGPPSR